jgi:hypothetical protein
MPRTSCGFNDDPNGPRGSDLLEHYGPTLIVNIGFDPNYDPLNPSIPAHNVVGVYALVDTGALESCIDDDVAQQAGLAIMNRRAMSGSAGRHLVSVYLAQIHVPSLSQTIYGEFCGVDLTGGGQTHRALIGRTFLRHYKMTYDGATGDVTLES